MDGPPSATSRTTSTTARRSTLGRRDDSGDEASARGHDVRPARLHAARRTSGSAAGDASPGRGSGRRRPGARSSTSGRTSSAGFVSRPAATRAPTSPCGMPRSSSTASSVSAPCAPRRRPTGSSSAAATTSSSRRSRSTAFATPRSTGYPGELTADALEAIVVHSDLERIGHFSCSDDLLNQLHANVVWGLRGNFVDVPTDCPQRDERLGWTGDLAVFAPTAAFLYDVQSIPAGLAPRSRRRADRAGRAGPVRRSGRDQVHRPGGQRVR